jgi:CRP-like cAMP-binding protein
MEKFRKQLNAECNYCMKAETMELFLGLMTELKFKRNEAIIPYGECDSNIYIVKEGIVRVAYFDGFREKTFVFGLPATVFFSYYSFLKSSPSFSQVEACCDSVVMKVTKAGYIDLMKRSHDFAQWVAFMSLEQLLFHEKKLEVVNGDVLERFEALMKYRPEIIENVSLKTLASYLGISPEYLSRMKKRFMLKTGK